MRSPLLVKSKQPLDLWLLQLSKAMKLVPVTMFLDKLLI
jgi:hypothetical protein